MGAGWRRLAPDAVGGGGHERGEREVRVRVGAGPAALEPPQLRPRRADRAHGAGAVLVPPGRVDRREPARDEALVRVDRRVQQQRGGRQVLEHAGDRRASTGGSGSAGARRGERVRLARSTARGGRGRSIPPRRVRSSRGSSRAGPSTRRPASRRTSRSAASSAAASPRRGSRFSSSRPGPGLRVHRGQLDPEPLERRDELVEEPLVPADLVQAVADPARQRLALRVPDPDLVLERRHHLVAEVRRRRRGRGGRPRARRTRRRAVGPARRREADAPARPPAQVAQRVGVGAHDQVGGARRGSRTARSRRSACRPGRARG